MKTLRHPTRRQPESNDNSFDAGQSEYLSNSDDELQNSDQTSAPHLTQIQTLGDRIRKYCLYILSFALTCHAVFGEIKNGYEKNIAASKESIRILRASLLEDDLAPAQRRKVQSTIATLVNHVSFYELTESLLVQFKTIAPALYAEIDTITDRLGRPVHVYIKFVPVNSTDIKAEGSTYMDQQSHDHDMAISEFGESTVSIKVWIVQRALLVLAHELGHVKYQVPNLASYLVYHKNQYSGTSTPNSIGHDLDDPSGNSATAYAKRFIKIYVDFIKLSDVKVQKPLLILTKLKKDWSKNT